MDFNVHFANQMALYFLRKGEKSTECLEYVEQT